MDAIIILFIIILVVILGNSHNIIYQKVGIIVTSHRGKIFDLLILFS